MPYACGALYGASSTRAKKVLAFGEVANFETDYFLLKIKFLMPLLVLSPTCKLLKICW
jgi:hypothetical protein